MQEVETDASTFSDENFRLIGKTKTTLLIEFSSALLLQQMIKG